MEWTALQPGTLPPLLCLFPWKQRWPLPLGLGLLALRGVTAFPPWAVPSSLKYPLPLYLLFLCGRGGRQFTPSTLLPTHLKGQATQLKRLLERISFSWRFPWKYIPLGLSSLARVSRLPPLFHSYGGGGGTPLHYWGWVSIASHMAISSPVPLACCFLMVTAPQGALEL